MSPKRKEQKNLANILKFNLWYGVRTFCKLCAFPRLPEEYHRHSKGRRHKVCCYCRQEIQKETRERLYGKGKTQLIANAVSMRW